MAQMKKYHSEAMEKSQRSQKRVHHSDPIVGGESEREGRVMGHGDFANLPQREVMMKPYPKAAEFGPDVLDDTMGHVDTVNKKAHQRARSHLSNQH